MNNNFMNAGAWFPGGSGMFIEYHDIVRPVYLTALKKMILSDNNNLPFALLKPLSDMALAEWYLNRKNINPLIDLDIFNKYDHKYLDQWMDNILLDDSVFSLSPKMKVCDMFTAKEFMKIQFPVFVYSRTYSKNIEKDIKTVFGSTVAKYLHGDLSKALSNLDMNCTYIFSDIDLAADATKLLLGKTSHILIARDFRYNHSNDDTTLFKHNLENLMKKYPISRIEHFLAIDRKEIIKPLPKL